MTKYNTIIFYIMLQIIQSLKKNDFLLLVQLSKYNIVKLYTQNYDTYYKIQFV